MRIFVDVETIPSQIPGALAAIQASIKPPGNYSKPDTIAKWLAENAAIEADKQWRKTAFSGTHGEIVVIGFALGDGDVEMFHREPGEAEQDLLWLFWDTLLERIQARNGHPAGVEWCGHNVAFDLRFLKQRSIVHGITPTVRVNPDARHAAGHLFDTMQESRRLALTRCAASWACPAPRRAAWTVPRSSTCGRAGGWPRPWRTARATWRRCVSATAA